MLVFIWEKGKMNMVQRGCGCFLTMVVTLALQSCGPKSLVNTLADGSNVSRSPVCLVRTHADGETKVPFYRPDLSAWETQNVGRVHMGHNEVPECNLEGAQCRVSKGDRFTIRRVSALPNHFKYMRDPKPCVQGAPCTMPNEFSDLRLSENKAYLHGGLKSSAGKYADVFIMLADVIPCDEIDASYPEDKFCKVYTIEIYPDKVTGWNDYRPDGPRSKVIWHDRPCSEIPGIVGVLPGVLQPGGGGGHDPP